MIPQMIVVAWLTLVWLVIAKQMNVILGWNDVDSRILALIVIAVVVVALYFGNFWKVIS